MCYVYIMLNLKEETSSMSWMSLIGPFASPRLASCHLAGKDFEIFQLGQKLDASCWDGYPNAKEVTISGGLRV